MTRRRDSSAVWLAGLEWAEEFDEAEEAEGREIHYGHTGFPAARHTPKKAGPRPANRAGAVSCAHQSD